MIEAGNFARVCLHDCTFAKGDLSVARDGNFVPLFNRHYRCCVKYHFAHTPFTCSHENAPAHSVPARRAEAFSAACACAAADL